ncbi:hypothetical protein GCM10025881_33410 [Pseudolysinimonas kribbensis]|uniref:Uncharacterized protein n=1 Tax=Pseudolysinimonas kribbensis TaxID=433641 RepID=A0ABQ6K940_9MICO|nr:hypothetical protein GCM10025881_33410 [Pseudolysinimonas kribbensis]
MQRRERIVGDLRAGSAHGGDEARLAGARIPDERHVGDGLQLQPDVALPAVRAEKREPGRLAFRCRKSRIAEPALAARGDDDLQTRGIQVGEHGSVGILDDRADRHREHETLPRVPRAVIAHARAAVAA